MDLFTVYPSLGTEGKVSTHEKPYEHMGEHGVKGGDCLPLLLCGLRRQPYKPISQKGRTRCLRISLGVGRCPGLTLHRKRKINLPLPEGSPWNWWRGLRTGRTRRVTFRIRGTLEGPEVDTVTTDTVCTLPVTVYYPCRCKCRPKPSVCLLELIRGVGGTL